MKVVSVTYYWVIMLMLCEPILQLSGQYYNKNKINNNNNDNNIDHRNVFRMKEMKGRSAQSWESLGEYTRFGQRKYLGPGHRGIHAASRSHRKMAADRSTSGGQMLSDERRPGQCYYWQSGKYIKTGRNRPRYYRGPGCTRLTCTRSGEYMMLEKTGCGKSIPKRMNCRNYSLKWKPYPQCCPKQICHA